MCSLSVKLTPLLMEQGSQPAFPVYNKGFFTGKLRLVENPLTEPHPTYVSIDRMRFVAG